MTDTTQEYDPIPETVPDAIAMWDADKSLFSVELGGLGPGYEMSIQGLAFEMMREVYGFGEWDDERDIETLNRRLDAVASRLNDEPWAGFSGAQVGAAKSFAAIVCRRGYRAALREPSVKDRLIQVCRKDLRK